MRILKQICLVLDTESLLSVRAVNRGLREACSEVPMTFRLTLPRINSLPKFYGNFPPIIKLQALDAAMAAGFKTALLNSVAQAQLQQQQQQQLGSQAHANFCKNTTNLAANNSNRGNSSDNNSNNLSVSDSSSSNTNQQETAMTSVEPERSSSQHTQCHDISRSCKDGENTIASNSHDAQLPSNDIHCSSDVNNNHDCTRINNNAVISSCPQPPNHYQQNNTNSSNNNNCSGHSSSQSTGQSSSSSLPLQQPPPQSSTQQVVVQATAASGANTTVGAVGNTSSIVAGSTGLPFGSLPAAFMDRLPTSLAALQLQQLQQSINQRKQQQQIISAAGQSSSAIAWRQRMYGLLRAPLKPRCVKLRLEGGSSLYRLPELPTSAAMETCYIVQMTVASMLPSLEALTTLASVESITELDLELPCHPKVMAYVAHAFPHVKKLTMSNLIPPPHNHLAVLAAAVQHVPSQQRRALTSGGGGGNLSITNGMPSTSQLNNNNNNNSNENAVALQQNQQQLPPPSLTLSSSSTYLTTLTQNVGSTSVAFNSTESISANAPANEATGSEIQRPLNANASINLLAANNNDNDSNYISNGNNNIHHDSNNNSTTSLPPPSPNTRPPTAAVAAAVPLLNNLRSLNVSATSWDQLFHLSSLTNLEHLSVRYYIWNIPELWMLTSLRRLKSFEFRAMDERSRFQLDFLSCFQSLPALERLSVDIVLARADSNGDSMEFIKACSPNLNSLDLTLRVPEDSNPTLRNHLRLLPLVPKGCTVSLNIVANALDRHLAQSGIWGYAAFSAATAAARQWPQAASSSSVDGNESGGGEGNRGGNGGVNDSSNHISNNENVDNSTHRNENVSLTESSSKEGDEGKSIDINKNSNRQLIISPSLCSSSSSSSSASISSSSAAATSTLASSASSSLGCGSDCFGEGIFACPGCRYLASYLPYFQSVAEASSTSSSSPLSSATANAANRMDPFGFGPGNTAHPMPARPNTPLPESRQDDLWSCLKLVNPGTSLKLSLQGYTRPMNGLPDLSASMLTFLKVDKCTMTDTCFRMIGSLTSMKHLYLRYSFRGTLCRFGAGAMCMSSHLLQAVGEEGKFEEQEERKREGGHLEGKRRRRRRGGNDMSMAAPMTKNNMKSLDYERSNSNGGVKTFSTVSTVKGNLLAVKNGRSGNNNEYKGRNARKLLSASSLVVDRIHNDFSASISPRSDSSVTQVVGGGESGKNYPTNFFNNTATNNNNCIRSTMNDHNCSSLINHHNHQSRSRPTTSLPSRQGSNILTDNNNVVTTYTFTKPQEKNVSSNNHRHQSHPLQKSHLPSTRTSHFQTQLNESGEATGEGEGRRNEETMKFVDNSKLSTCPDPLSVKGEKDVRRKDEVEPSSSGLTEDATVQYNMATTAGWKEDSINTESKTHAKNTNTSFMNNNGEMLTDREREDLDSEDNCGNGEEDTVTMPEVSRAGADGIEIEGRKRQRRGYESDSNLILVTNDNCVLSKKRNNGGSNDASHSGIRAKDNEEERKILFPRESVMVGEEEEEKNQDIDEHEDDPLYGSYIEKGEEEDLVVSMDEEDVEEDEDYDDYNGDEDEEGEEVDNDMDSGNTVDETFRIRKIPHPQPFFSRKNRLSLHKTGFEGRLGVIWQAPCPLLHLTRLTNLESIEIHETCAFHSSEVQRRMQIDAQMRAERMARRAARAAAAAAAAAASTCKQRLCSSSSAMYIHDNNNINHSQVYSSSRLDKNHLAVLNNNSNNVIMTNLGRKISSTSPMAALSLHRLPLPSKDDVGAHPQSDQLSQICNGGGGSNGDHPHQDHAANTMASPSSWLSVNGPLGGGGSDACPSTGATIEEERVNNDNSNRINVNDKNAPSTEDNLRCTTSSSLFEESSHKNASFQYSRDNTTHRHHQCNQNNNALTNIANNNNSKSIGRLTNNHSRYLGIPPNPTPLTMLSQVVHRPKSTASPATTIRTPTTRSGANTLKNSTTSLSTSASGSGVVAEGFDRRCFAMPVSSDDLVVLARALGPHVRDFFVQVISSEADGVLPHAAANDLDTIRRVQEEKEKEKRRQRTSEEEGIEDHKKVEGRDIDIRNHRVSGSSSIEKPFVNEGTDELSASSTAPFSLSSASMENNKQNGQLLSYCIACGMEGNMVSRQVRNRPSYLPVWPSCSFP
mmetsp:Transcript_19029/g.34439  ORF Transcript_19029/g.34439 Transcript_19029/m.34439 type:complete len:2147 (+) Transcript_19029:516-6956(+)